MKACKIIEITVCYDVYFDFAFNNKCEREPVQNFLNNKQWKVDLIVLCFGSLGYIKNNVYRDLRKMSAGKVTSRKHYDGALFQI